jgi:hypothetical protein
MEVEKPDHTLKQKFGESILSTLLSEPSDIQVVIWNKNKI